MISKGRALYLKDEYRRLNIPSSQMIADLAEQIIKLLERIEQLEKEIKRYERIEIINQIIEDIIKFTGCNEDQAIEALKKNNNMYWVHEYARMYGRLP